MCVDLTNLVLAFLKCLDDTRKRRLYQSPATYQLKRQHLTIE